MIGYDVRLFNSDTKVEIVRRVDATGTYYIFLPSDKALTEHKLTTVQVCKCSYGSSGIIYHNLSQIRVVSSTEEGHYSSPEELGR